MEISLFSLFILTGFIFLRFNFLIAHTYQSLDQQDKIFSTALAGLFFASVSYILTPLIWRFEDHLCPLINYCCSVANRSSSISTDLILTILISYSIVIIVNLASLNQKKLRTVVSEKFTDRDEFEYFLLDGMKKRLPVQLTLENGKVYVVRVTVVPKRSEDYLRGVPIFSGYRDDEQELIILNDYSHIEGRKSNVIIISKSRIISSSYFNYDVYLEHIEIRNQEITFELEETETILNEPQKD